ncbi:LysR substrate-binding domain-containing protein [Burkholderia seminalis]|uniref:LysR substrate-binding domain-containing protein n=1 Tax=Burkholderia seminalis TaxID=488731 RepID=UPI001CF41818|nr:LysR substrate-binding domain-containing protein [Burkholderia seminalis]MCA8039831.1 hypothetical protein [Burkholderia seminalis]
MGQPERGRARTRADRGGRQQAAHADGAARGHDARQPHDATDDADARRRRVSRLRAPDPRPDGRARRTARQREAAAERAAARERDARVRAQPCRPRDLALRRAAARAEPPAACARRPRISRGAARHTEAVRINGNLTTNDGEIAAKWALDGHGILMRAEWDLRDYLADGRLVVVLPNHETPSADIYAVYAQRHQTSARIRASVDFLAEELRRLKAA